MRLQMKNMNIHIRINVKAHQIVIGAVVDASVHKLNSISYPLK